METEILLLLAKLDLETNSAKRAQLILELKSRNVKTHIIAKETDLTAPQIRHHYRIAHKLQPTVMQLLEEGKITFSLARAIASLPGSKQERAARDAISKGTSVSCFRNKLKNNDDQALLRELERLSQQCSDVSGLDIQIKADRHNAKAGYWMIRYADLDMFDCIASKIIGKLSDY